MVIIKKILKAVWDEFIYGGHLLSLGASGILAFSALIFNQKNSASLLIVGYAISQIVYFYNHYKEAKKDFLTNPERAEHIKKARDHFLLLMVFYFSLFFVSLIYLNNLKAVLAALFICLGGLLFTDVFKKFTEKIIGFKNFYTAFFWALLILLAGFYYSIPLNSPSFLLLFSFVFLRWLVNAIFFDIKDIKSDKEEKLRTFPVLFGKNKALNYLHIANIVSFAPIIMGVLTNLLPLFSLFLLVFYLYSFYYLERAKNKKTNVRRLSYIMVDGEYVFWPFILLLGKFIVGL